MQPLYLILALLFISSCSGKKARALETTGSDVQVAAFVYHRFGDSRHPSTNISRKDFEAHLKHLKDNSILTLPLGEALDSIKTGCAADRIVTITIDDGYRSFKENGWPLLKKYGFRATLFINTESVGAADYLNWDEIKTLKEEGVEIGNHSHSHPYFLNYTPEELAEKFDKELTLSQSLFKKRLGSAPELFAYPYGEHNDEMKKLLEAHGFKAAAAQNSGVIDQNSDRFALPRFPMATAFASLDRFKEKAAMYALPVRSVGFQAGDSAFFQLAVDSGDVNLDQTQVFVKGKNYSDRIKVKAGSSSMVEALLPVFASERRTLYTFTAPSLSGGKWYWFSYVSVNPGVEE